MGWFIKENWPTLPVLIVLWWQTNTKPYGTGHYRPTQFPCKRVYHPHHRKSTKRFSRNPNHHLNSTPWANQSFDDSFVFQGKRQTGGNNRQKEIPPVHLSRQCRAAIDGSCDRKHLVATHQIEGGRSMVNMRPFNPFEQRNLRFLVNLGLKFTQVEITPTGLGKSILDATAPMRTFFLEHDIHDYEGIFPLQTNRTYEESKRRSIRYVAWTKSHHGGLALVSPKRTWRYLFLQNQKESYVSPVPGKHHTRFDALIQSCAFRSFSARSYKRWNASCARSVPRNPRIAPSSSRWWSDPHSTPRKRNPSSRPRWQMTDDSF